MTKTLNYKKKTRFFSKPTLDHFAVPLFNLDDVNTVINDVFNQNTAIDKDSLLTTLNNIIRFICRFFPDSINLSPRKIDERHLLEQINKQSIALAENLNILRNRYGLETFFCLSTYSFKQHKTLGPETFLEDLEEQLRQLCLEIPNVIKVVLSTKSGSRGSNSKKAIPTLIFYLAGIYEKITNKKANLNFFHPKAARLNYSGQFFDFVSTIFIMVQRKFNKDKVNPFKIALGQSKALGKHIERTLKKMNNIKDGQQ